MKRRFWKNGLAFTAVLAFLVFASVGFFFRSLSAERYAQAAADAIATGKTQLFQKSVSGALNSYQTFLAAYNGGDYASATPEQKIKIRAYLAFTRILDVALRNDGGGVDTLTGLLAQYGITRTGDALDALKFDLPLNDDRKIILPAGAPSSAEALRSFFSGPFLAAVNASIADMDAVIALCPDTEGIDREIITKTMLGVTDPTRLDIEIDAGDYYLFRALLKFLKVYALMSAGYNANLDIRQVVALANMEMGPEAMKRLLDRYPEFLKVLPVTGAAKLNEARLTLIDAITDYETASAKIRGDINTQAGAEELISIDITGRAREAFVREQMALVKNSLQNNTAVALGGSTENWSFNTSPLQGFSATFDDNFSGGRYYASGTGAFGYYANLDYALVNGTDITLRFTVNYPSYGWAEFHGTLNAGKTQITNGTYIGYSYYPVTGSYSGTFSAVRTSVTSKTKNVNIFPLFGDGSTSGPTAPKALRDLMPQLNDFGYPAPGTMGNGVGNDPTLGGIMPDFTTQDQWLRELDGPFMTSGPLTIHQAADGAIAINGNATDWAGIAPVLTDVTGEKGQNMAANGDLQKLFLARDNTYLYVRMDLAGDWNLSGQSFMYGIRFRQTPDGPDKKGDVKIFARNRDGVWQVMMMTAQSGGNSWSMSDLGPAGGSAAATGNVVEWRVPLTSLGTLDGRFLSADTDSWSYNSYGWDYWSSYDRNRTGLQIQPAASVTGNLSVPGYDGVGPVRIGVFEYGPDFSTDPKKRIGSLGIFPDGSGNLPATYTVNNLPVGQRVFVTVFWDRDNNGVISPGDYTNFYQPFTTAAGVNSLNLTAADDHSAYPPPRFYTTVVYHEKRPPPPTGGGNWNVVIAAQLTGPGPDDVTVTVTGPGGQYTLMPGAVISKRGLVYRTTVYSLPNGDYTFTAVDSLGRKTEATYHYEERYDLPNIASLTPASGSYVGTTTPTLSWTKPAEGYAYQVWVADYNNSNTGLIWYVSAITTGTSVTIPAGVLLPGTPYYWFVRLFDRANNPMNYAMSPIYSFYTGDYAASPVFSSVQVNTKPPTGSIINYSNQVDAKVQGLAPWDVTGWRLKKGGTLIPTSQGGTSQGGTPYFDVRADDSTFNPGFQTATRLSDGNDYSFEMDVKRPAGSTTTITQTGISFFYQGVQAVDVTSLVPSGNYYFKASTPTFSWSPVSDPNAYYRLRIFDPLWGKVILYRSAWSKETQATVPAGVLKPGGNYYWTVQTTSAINPSYVTAFANTEGNSANKALFRFTLLPPLPGDVNGNGEVTLEDAILALRVVSGFTPAITPAGDADADNRIGLPEAIYILQTLSGLR